jgi:hypothetical protein
MQPNHHERRNLHLTFVFVEACREMRAISAHDQTFLLHCAASGVGQSGAQLDSRRPPEMILDMLINLAKAPTSSNGIPDLDHLKVWILSL